jgi:hypothetical protein
MYFFFTLPGKSHLMNPGDQWINVSIRKAVRRQSKVRAVLHWIQVQWVNKIKTFILFPNTDQAQAYSTEFGLGLQ